MSQFFVIHPENPQKRLIKQAVKIIEDGGIMVYPTDSGYAIGCQLENKEAADRIRQLRHLDEQHHFTLVCKDLSELSSYAVVDNYCFRLLKANTPGPYTFILKATPEVPRRLQDPKKKTIGIRVPDSKIVEAFLKELGEPLMSVSLILPDQDFPFANAEDIHQTLCSKVNLIIDGGPCRVMPTTVVDLVEGKPKIIRVGRGDPKVFEEV